MSFTTTRVPARPAEYLIPERNLDAIVDLIKDQTLSEQELVQTIQELGKSFLTNSQHHEFLAKCIAQYPTLSQHIGPSSRFSGSGWSIDYTSTYGLTFSGIKQMLAIKKVRAVVAETLPKLKNVYTNLQDGSRVAMIADAGILKGCEMNHHAVAVFLKREQNHITLMVLDSLANSYQEEMIVSQIPPHLEVTLFMAKKFRQQHNEVSCYAFAIDDCEVFQNNPNAMEEIAALNPRSHKITTFPEDFMSLSGETEQRMKAFEYQARIVYAASRGFSAIQEDYLEREPDSGFFTKICIVL